MDSANKKQTKRGKTEYNFKPGVSGNPSGRPKIPQEVKDAFREHTMDAKNVLVEIMMDQSQKGGDRVRAAETVLNRGWGTPEQAVSINGALATVPIDTSKLSDKQQDALLEALTMVLVEDESQPTD